MNSVPVWVWMPEETEPILAGELRIEGPHRGRFLYSTDFRVHPKATPLDPVSLRMAGAHGVPVNAPEGIPGVVMDACPAGYGEDLLQNLHGRDRTLTRIELLELGAGDAAGAVAACADIDRKLRSQAHSLDALKYHIEQLEAGQPRARAIKDMLGDMATSAGGDRPKATVEFDGRLWIAKMQARNDMPFLPTKEFVCMTLAGECDITVPDIRLETVADVAVLLVQRFDRHGDPKAPCKRLYASAHTALQLQPGAVAGAPARSYLALADKLRTWSRHSDDVQNDIRELWRRMCFNALVGNGDDHPRNHALYRVNEAWRLAPAFDITPLVGYRGSLSMGVEIRGGTAVSVERLLEASLRMGYASATEAAQWLIQAAGRVAQRWERDLAAAGVTPEAISGVRSAFALSEQLADSSESVLREAEGISSPSRRRKSAIAQSHRAG